MRQLLPVPDAPRDEDADELVRRTYGTSGALVRWNMVSTVDGSVTGSDGTSSTINNDPDHRVFGFLRSWADAVVIGAGTARAEGYAPLRPNRWAAMRDGRPPAPLLVVLSRRTQLPAALADAGDEAVLLLTGDPVAPREVVQHLHDLGHRRILVEGGPSLATGFAADGVIDELCLTIVPTLVGGTAGRITDGTQLSASARLASVLEEDGTLLTRWTL